MTETDGKYRSFSWSCDFVCSEILQTNFPQTFSAQIPAFIRVYPAEGIAKEIPFHMEMNSAFLKTQSMEYVLFTYDSVSAHKVILDESSSRENLDSAIISSM